MSVLRTDDGGCVVIGSLPRCPLPGGTDVALVDTDFRFTAWHERALKTDRGLPQEVKPQVLYPPGTLPPALPTSTIPHTCDS